MRRVALIVGGALVLAFVASEVALPLLTARDVEERLERDGGSADASVSAFPALRLLWGRGDRLEVEGRELAFDLRREPRVLERLDGFDEVEVRLDDVDLGPVAIGAFELARRDGYPEYELRVAGDTTPRALARELGQRAGGALGGLLGGLAAQRLPGGGSESVPFELEGTVESVDGEADFDDVQGSLAGVPAGPLAQLVVDAVVPRL